MNLLTRSLVNFTDKKSIIQNYIELAKEAEKSKNYAEAYIYYMKILEVEPRNYEAWRGKGTASGWQSNLMICRFDETKNSYQKALDLAPSDAMRDVLKIEISVAILILAHSYFDLSLGHTLQFTAIKNAQFEHADRIKNTIQLCDFAIYLNPDFDRAKSFISDIANRASKTSFLSYSDVKFFKEKKLQYSLFVEKSSNTSTDDPKNFLHGLLYVVAMAFSYFLLSNIFGVKNIIALIFGAFFTPLLITLVVIMFFLIFQKYK